jgi:hypothetical protein
MLSACRKSLSRKEYQVSLQTWPMSQTLNRALPPAQASHPGMESFPMSHQDGRGQTYNYKLPVLLIRLNFSSPSRDRNGETDLKMMELEIKGFRSRRDVFWEPGDLNVRIGTEEPRKTKTGC